MINGLEGIPGSGKSYEAVAYHVLPALKAGRKVITNLPLNLDAFAAIDPSYPDLIEVRTRPAPKIGDWNPANIAEHEAFLLWSDRLPEPHAEDVFTFGTVWDFYSDWRGPKGQGPLYVIDECHVAFPKIGTPDSVVQWFKLHRHFNADVLLMTQSFRDINQPISQLIATLIKCRKADILGRKDSYIRKVHAGYRGAVIQTDERKYKPQYFGLYRSNTQSSGTAEGDVQDVSPMIVKFNRVKWVVLALAFGACTWAFWPKTDTNIWGARTVTVKPLSMSQSPLAAAAAARSAQAQPQAQTVPENSRAQAPVVASVQDPLFGKMLHMTGDISNTRKAHMTFVVSDQGRRVFEITSEDLVSAGYSVKRLAHCMATVKYEGTVRPVTCDAPYMNQGSQDRPVVIDSGTGARSDDNQRRRAIVDVPREAQIEQQAQANGYLDALARRNAQVRSNLIP